MARALASLLVLATLMPTVVAQRRLPQRREITVEGGKKLGYWVFLPKEHDPKKAWPLLFWDEGLIAPTHFLFGWILIQPDRSAGGPCLIEREAWMRALLRQLRIDHRIAGNRMHLLGERTALQVLQWQPQEFQSLVLCAAGTYPPAALAAARGLDVVLFDHDQHRAGTPQWDALEQALRAAGARVTRTEAALPDAIERLRAAAPPLGEAQRAVAGVLDDFHDAAAKADADRYFAHFAPEGVFLGTDASERWPLTEFKAFALPHFRKESAWIFVPQTRHIDLAPGDEFAWFDEELGSASYGRCRGSGALRKADGRWLLVQYNLSIPLPNDLAREVVARIRAFEAQPASQPASRPASATGR